MLREAERIHSADCSSGRQDTINNFFVDSCYNEVLLSRDSWEGDLPRAVQAVAVGREGSLARAQHYRELFVEHFNLAEGAVPVLRLDLPGDSRAPFAVAE